MKLLTWNCNLNLAQKFQILEPYNSDIFIIQECERLKTNFFPNYDYFWVGKNEKKRSWHLGHKKFGSKNK